MTTTPHATLSAFGALASYTNGRGSLIGLRCREPAFARPYRAPIYPAAHALALVLAAGAFATMAGSNPLLCLCFVAIVAVAATAGARGKR